MNAKELLDHFRVNHDVAELLWRIARTRYIFNIVGTVNRNKQHWTVKLRHPDGSCVRGVEWDLPMALFSALQAMEACERASEEGDCDTFDVEVTHGNR